MGGGVTGENLWENPHPLLCIGLGPNAFHCILSGVKATRANRENRQLLLAVGQKLWMVFELPDNFPRWPQTVDSFVGRRMWEWPKVMWAKCKEHCYSPSSLSSFWPPKGKHSYAVWFLEGQHWEFKLDGRDPSWTFSPLLFFWQFCGVTHDILATSRLTADWKRNAVTGKVDLWPLPTSVGSVSRRLSACHCELSSNYTKIMTRNIWDTFR